MAQESEVAPIPINDIPDGGSMTVESDSSDRVYMIKNLGGVYSCDCQAWKFQKRIPIEQRTCKHIQKIRGVAAEAWRIGHSARGALVNSANLISATGQVMKPEAMEIHVLLAKVWDESIDPTGKWASRKLDGVRAYWNAETRQLLSRQGNEFMAPEWFKQGFPDFDLDGELYGGVGSFQVTVGIVKRLAEDEGWQKVKYFVFDIPSSEPFTERYFKLQQWVATSKPPCVTLVEQIPCTGREHLQEMLDAELAIGGEGIMLRDPSSSYERKRSKTLLKVKKMLDAEAQVIAYTGGTGKYNTAIGALTCLLPSGKHVNLGTGLSDAERYNPPAIGAVVTFGYQELSNDGIPRFPRFLRVSDKTWEDVLKNDHDGSDLIKPAIAAESVMPKKASRPRKQAAKPMAKKASTGGPTLVDGECYRYELVDPSINADKFWEVKIEGSKMNVHYGRNGTGGQKMINDLGTTEAAIATASKKAKAKEKEGYKLKKMC